MNCYFCQNILSEIGSILRCKNCQTEVDYYMSLNISDFSKTDNCLGYSFHIKTDNSNYEYYVDFRGKNITYNILKCPIRSSNKNIILYSDPNLTPINAASKLKLILTFY